MNERAQARADRSDRMAFLGGQRAYRHQSTMAFAMLEGMIKSPKNGHVEMRIAANVRYMK